MNLDTVPVEEETPESGGNLTHLSTITGAGVELSRGAI